MSRATRERAAQHEKVLVNGMTPFVRRDRELKSYAKARAMGGDVTTPRRSNVQRRHEHEAKRQQRLADVVAAKQRYRDAVRFVRQHTNVSLDQATALRFVDELFGPVINGGVRASQIASARRATERA